MKKYVFYFLSIFVMALVCVGFTACSNDDESGEKLGLEGVWKRTYKLETTYNKDAAGEWKKISEEAKTYADNQGSHGFMFLSGGKANLLYDVKADGSYRIEAECKYKISNGYLYLMELDENDKDDWEKWGKITISGNTFELYDEDIDKDFKEYETTRYKKI